MQVTDVVPWLSLGPFGVAIFLLLKDNFRLRGEVLQQDKVIEQLRSNKVLSDNDKAKFEAQTIGLTQRNADLVASEDLLRKELSQLRSEHTAIRTNRDALRSENEMLRAQLPPSTGGDPV